MYATIVIDIPDLNHQGFHYRIPEELSASIQVGCRVLVPLGPRTILGYVIDIHPETELKGIKNIKENLDIVPSLTEELIKLGLWMSTYFVSNLFRTLQVLLPASLKTRVEQYIFVREDIDINKLAIEDRQILLWVIKKQPVNQANLFNNFQNNYQNIQQLLKEGALVIKKDIKDKGTTKKVLVVKAKLSHQQLLLEIASLSKQAKKQREVLEYLSVNLQEHELVKLTKELNINRQSINALIEKGILELFEKELLRDPYKEREFNDKRVVLNKQQRQVLDRLILAIDQQDSSPFLLHGVTGSGKTEIYLHLIEEILQRGKEAIVLVPEISLTPQMVERFKGRFGSAVAVLHSRLSQGEKLDEWRRIQRGEAKIAIGARSAIFAPFKALGIIIIDEEHESSYKQEEHPKYHARDIARFRAEYNNAVALFGSATPSLESYHLSRIGEYNLLEMPNRITGSAMPTMHIVDMRDELRAGNRSMFSQKLQNELELRLDSNEQAVLFLNRRGYSTVVMCRSCGYVIKCPHCEISLTFHQTNRFLRCHYCGHGENEPNVCPECGSEHIRFFGTGTQKVEQELALRFPGVRVIRMDVDTTNKKGAHEKLLSSFRRQEADILLGTQMIAKGLDFPKVTLVGVIAADTSLKIPDFRAAERTFQLLTQVGGRAGRHSLTGDVVIQTYNPEHYSIQFASNHDYLSFFSQELEQRKLMAYPPFNKLVLLHFSHIDQVKLMKQSELFTRELKKITTNEIEILGPVAAPISRIKDRYRYQCMIKYNDKVSIIPQIKRVINYLYDEVKDRQLLISVDVDPYVLM